MTADIQAAVERLSQSRDRARETAKRGDIFDPNPQLAAVAIEASNYANAVDTVLAALAEANEARSILQQAVLERTAERDEAKAECDLLQEVLDGRPAINAALPDSYIRWSQGVMSGDVIRALLSKGGEGEGEDGGPCAICSDPEDDGPCPEHRPAPATAALATNPDNPPEGFRRLPPGIRCRCIRLWRGASGDHYCCRPVHEQGEG